MKKFEIYILIAGVLLCAFLSTSRTVDKELTIRCITWGLVTLLLFFSIVVRGAEFAILKRWIFPAFLGYLAFCFISLTKATNVSEGLWECFKVFVMFWYFVTATIVLQNDRDKLIKSVAVLALILGAYGLYEYFTMTYGLRTGTMSGRNLWSAAHLIMLPFCIYALGFKRYWRGIAVMSIILILFNITTLQTRSVWLATVISILAVSFFARPKLVVVALVVIALSGFFLRDRIDTRSFYQRKQLWGATLRMYNKEGPVGSGNWRIIIPKYGSNLETFDRKITSFVNMYWQQPHNDFIKVLSETGPAGLMFYLMIFALGLFYLFKARSIFLMGLVGYMVFAFFDFPKTRVFHPMMLMLILALSIPKAAVWRLSRRIICVVGVLVTGVLLFALFDFYKRYTTECYVRKIIVARKKYQWDKVLDETQKYSWFSQLDPLNTPIYWYRASAKHLTGNVDIMDIIDDFQRAERANPNYIIGLCDLGSCYSYIGKNEDAAHYYRRVLAMCPSFLPAKKNLAIVNARMNK